jgi:hypothetical protein
MSYLTILELHRILSIDGSSVVGLTRSWLTVASRWPLFQLAGHSIDGIGASGATARGEFGEFYRSPL